MGLGIIRGFFYYIYEVGVVFLFVYRGRNRGLARFISVRVTFLGR